MKIKDFVTGDGPVVIEGYRRGDSWVQTSGLHVDCDDKVRVIGPGIGRRDNKQRMDHGVLVRCGGCKFSWVIC